MKFSKNKNWPGIKQSLIASVLFLLILNPLIDIFKGVAAKGMVALADYFFYSCGHSSTWSFVNYTVYLAFAWFFVGEFIDYAKIYGKVFSNNSRKSFTASGQHEGQDRSETDKAIAAAIAAEKVKSRDRRDRVVMKILYWTCIMVMILLFLYIIVYKYVPSVMNESFEKRILQITPYTSREEIDLLRSHWCSMESKIDYETIVEQIHSVLIENNLK